MNRFNIVASVGVLLVAGIALVGCEQMHRNTTIFTVDSKDRPCFSTQDKHGSHVTCRYMIYGKGGEVFRNEDAFVIGERWKMDSASMQGRLQAGHTYSVKTIGWRIPFLSLSPNIIEATEVTHGTAG